MFCAGWVHRDISCNNVMAVRDSETQQWKLKLADLEYSKKFGLHTGTSDPKIVRTLIFHLTFVLSFC